MSRKGGFESKIHGLLRSSHCTGVPPRGRTEKCHWSLCFDPFPVSGPPTTLWGAAAFHHLGLAQDHSSFKCSVLGPSGVSEFAVSTGDGSYLWEVAQVVFLTFKFLVLLRNISFSVLALLRRHATSVNWLLPVNLMGVSEGVWSTQETGRHPILFSVSAVEQKTMKPGIFLLRLGRGSVWLKIQVGKEEKAVWADHKT